MYKVLKSWKITEISLDNNYGWPQSDKIILITKQASNTFRKYNTYFLPPMINKKKYFP